MNFIRPVLPSKTLASFLEYNTGIPFLVWMMILDKKHALENYSLNDDNYECKNNIKKLRSGVAYVTPLGNQMNLKRKMIPESYRLFNKFIYQKRLSKTHPYKKEMIYECSHTFMNYLVDWSHYIMLNAHIYKIPSFIRLYRQICATTLRIASEIVTENSLYPGRSDRQRQFADWSNMIAKDISTYRKYITCACNWYQDPNKDLNKCVKCDQCRKTEQYIYNYENYTNNFMVLRSGRYIRKPNAFREPITIQKVYKIMNN